MFKIIGKFGYLFLIVLTIAFAVAEGIAFPAQWIRPMGTSVITLLSMVEPFLILANLFFALFWIAMWKPWAIVSTIVTVASFGHMGSYFTPRISRDYGLEIKEKKQLRVAHYNVKGFNNSIADMDSALTIIANYKPDIVSITEFASLGNEGKALIEEKFPKLKYHVSNKGVESDLLSDFGVIILSKYPLKHPSKYENEGEGTAIMADAVIDYGDTLRLFSLHLHSTRYNVISREKSIESYMVDSMSAPINTETGVGILKERTDTLLATISNSSNFRSYQADTIRLKIEESPYKSIVMGDFNDTPYSYTVRTIMGDTHVDPFRVVARNQYGYSFNKLHRLFRIDYILPEKEYYDVLEYKTFESEVSDHNPVMVSLRPKR